VVETERQLFIGKQIITLSPMVHIKLRATEHIKSHRFSLSTFQSFTPPFTTRCTTPTSHSMASEADQAHHVVDKLAADEGRSNSRTESDVPVTSSSATMATIKIADKTILDMSDYWKKSMITEADRKAYHSFGWLNDSLESSISEVIITTVDGSTIVYFESHLITGLDLPPSKFLVAVMNFLGCELVHLNPNSIAALSCFTMLCEW
jgi:hypothetical protein